MGAGPWQKPHLQVVDVLLRVKVNTLRRLLHRHHGEPHVNAAMQLLSLNLQKHRRGCFRVTVVKVVVTSSPSPPTSSSTSANAKPGHK